MIEHGDNFDEFPYPFDKVDDKSKNIIKVIGVGGGGGNAVKNMAKQGVKNVSFAVVNTDSQALSNSDIPTKVAIGNTGLGVGGKPELGRESAEMSNDSIRSLFDDGTKMVFITAGMGGGTGTGASPVIARIAREMDILTVGVVTLPFLFEKRLRIEKALRGVEELKRNVDALLVINNQRLLEVYSDGILTVEDAFMKADDVLTVATKSIAEIITVEGKVNRDFCDVQTVMKNGGGAIVSEGRASGENRILKAMQSALKTPLFNKVEVERAQRLLYVIYQSHKSPVMVTELSEINEFMDNLAGDLEVLWGLYWDDSLEDEVKVTIVATGFDKERPSEQVSMQDASVSSLMDIYYDKQEKAAPKPVCKSVAKEEKELASDDKEDTDSCEREFRCSLPGEQPYINDGDDEEEDDENDRSQPQKKTFVQKMIELLGSILDDPN